MTTCGHLDQIRDVTPEANELEIRPEPDRPLGLDFVRLDESRKAQCRLHLDFRPDDQDAGVARLVAHDRVPPRRIRREGNGYRSRVWDEDRQ